MFSFDLVFASSNGPYLASKLLHRVQLWHYIQLRWNHYLRGLRVRRTCIDHFDFEMKVQVWSDAITCTLAHNTMGSKPSLVKACWLCTTWRANTWQIVLRYAPQATLCASKLSYYAGFISIVDINVLPAAREVLNTAVALFGGALVAWLLEELCYTLRRTPFNWSQTEWCSRTSLSVHGS